MTDQPDLAELLRKIRYDLTAAQLKLTDAMQALAAHHATIEQKPRRPNAPQPVARAGLSPRELHPDACPHCEILGGHTADCPTQTGENPNYGPGNPDFARDWARNIEEAP